MKKATPKKLTRLFRHIKGNNFSEDKAKYLIDLAQTSVYAGRASRLGECGDLRRFDSAKAFIGYLGLYPTQYQSGNSLSVGRLAKRGIPIAKHALYMAAVSSVRHNTQLNKLFHDKVSSGKSKKEALIIISKKNSNHYVFYCEIQQTL